MAYYSRIVQQRVQQLSAPIIVDDFHQPLDWESVQMPHKAPRVEERAKLAEDLPAFQGFKLLNLKTQVAELLSQIGRYGIFEEYTKHDVAHINEMLAIYDWMLPSDTQDRMSPADSLLLECSTILHDLGMIVTRDEYATRGRSGFEQYQQALLNDDDKSSLDYHAYLQSLDDAAREKFLYQEFVRTNHASRIRSWLQERPDPLLGYDTKVVSAVQDLLRGLDKIFIADVALVCESHHADDLHDTLRYPVSRPYGNSDDETANVQYTAIALRAADLLHITRDRTPTIAFKTIDPVNPNSQREWAKQRAVRRVRAKLGLNREGLPDTDAPRDTIEIHAQFEDSEGFFGLSSYLTYAKKQLQQCNEWAEHSRQQRATNHRFPWRYIDTTNVEATGFIAKQFQFTLDQARILDLLTGHTLYNDSSVVVRELTQNALDAVRFQSTSSHCTCKPEVWVFWSSRDQILQVVDNGTGMTQQIVEQNFLRVGSSRYQDSSFKRQYPNFSPISRFGIGVLSTFMISDEVRVVTSNIDEVDAREISLRSVHGEYLIKLFSKNDEHLPELVRRHGHGTAVSIRVRSSAQLPSVLDVLRKWIVVPQSSVFYREDDHPPVAVGFENLQAALEDVLSSQPDLDMVDGRFLTQYGAPVEARVVREDGIELAYAVLWHKYFNEWSFYSPTALLANDAQSRRALEDRLGICIEGIRVETGSPGFKPGRIMAIANAFGSRAPRPNVARIALERTDELRNFLYGLYEIYCSHLNREVSEMVSARGFSVTRAAGQVGYLVLPLDRSSEVGPVDDHMLRRALQHVKALVLEEGGVRQAISIAQLTSLRHFVTVDNLTVRRIEDLLRELPQSVTSLDVAKLAGVDRENYNSPTLCGRHSGPFGVLLHSLWEPSSISVVNGNSLRVSWQPAVQDEGKALWYRYSFQDLGPGLRYFVEAVLRGEERRYERRRYIRRSIFGQQRYRASRGTRFVATDVVPVSGLDEYDAVMIDGNLYVLPHSPLLDFQRNCDGDRNMRLALISAFADIIVDASYESDFIAFCEQEMRELGVENVVPLEDLMYLLKAEKRVFDISFWENRHLSDDDGL